MPSKEEIEQAKRNCKRVLETDPLKSTIDFQYNDVDTLIEGLEQLEAERQAVIVYIQKMIVTTEEFLEKIKNSTRNKIKIEMKAKLEVYKKILEIMKGK